MKSFYFKTKDARSIAEIFESNDTCLKNITTASFCPVDTSEKIFEIIIDVKIDIVAIDVTAEKTENETTTVDYFFFETESVLAIIINNLKIVVDIFDERFDFFF